MLKTFLLLNPVIASFFWAIFLLFKRRGQAHAKKFLGVFMFMAVVMYGAHNIYYQSLWEIYIHINGVYTFASLATFPMFYIYVRLVTVDTKFEFKKHFRYLIVPAIFAVALMVMDFLMTKEESLFYFKAVLLKGDVPNRLQRITFAIYTLARLTYMTEVVVYYFKVSRLVKTHNDKMLVYYSDIESRGLRWLSNSTILLFGAAFVGIAIAIIGREQFVDNMDVLYVFSVVVASGIFVFGYFGSKQKNTLIDVSNKAEVNVLEAVDEVEVQRRLLRLFENDKLFLNESLKLWDVSARLQVDGDVLARLLQERFQQNFSSFVNYYRVKHVKKILIQNQDVESQELAAMSGFESIKSLNKTFSHNEGLTISEYKRIIQ